MSDLLPRLGTAGWQARGVLAVPDDLRRRGFALYVGASGDPDGDRLRALADALRQRLSELVPEAESFASIVYAPIGTEDGDLDAVRLALHEPVAIEERARRPKRRGVVIDLSRSRVTVDGATADLTYREFELLRLLVSREGRTVPRAELITALWRPDEEQPVRRTVDVLVGRARAKLGDYPGIVRTVRGVGYRFDRHADVTVLAASAPSPDLF